MDNRTLQQFLDDRVTQLAVERAIEIIGEAARRVSEPFQSTHPEIPWRLIIGQRNILAHEYGHIDHALLFETATRDIPALLRELERALGV